MPRKVHDVTSVMLDNHVPQSNGTKPIIFPVAFIQWGTRDSGLQYEVVCPYCAKSIDWVDPGGVIRELGKGLATAMLTHYESKLCPRFGATQFDVEVTTESLGTETLPRVV